jgi:hypothetical protein
MSAVFAERTPAHELNPEWERLQLLGYCLTQTRRGQQIEDRELEQLQVLQEQVVALREEGGIWHHLLEVRLTPLEMDILACVVAPDLEPRLGWMYQNLQLGTTQPYPSRALIQELLALTPEQGEHLYQALSPSAYLRRHRLVRLERDDPYHPLQPESWLTGRLLGRKVECAAPPGSMRVEQKADWNSLVLPDNRLVMLREFLLWVEHRNTVVGEWGGQRVGGPVALFVGPSGTGKTLAASVIANALGWPLFRVDLGRLVSKYIGETEKNLNQLFDAASGQALVLQFDEADALFAKRGEVKEARDRYANMEVSHLLSRIEAHDGPCILTTNLRKQMDSAFTRRFQMVVEFPRPDPSARAALWRQLLPPRAPLSPEVDTTMLGDAVGLTGGGIRNAALHAAYLAAGQGTAIGLEHIALAVWRELAKEGREVGLHDLGVLAAHLPPGVADD